MARRGIQVRTADQAELWRKECLGKGQYDKQLARTKAARAEARGRGPMNVYRCRFCSHFHIGHKPLWALLRERGTA